MSIYLYIYVYICIQSHVFVILNEAWNGADQISQSFLGETLSFLQGESLIYLLAIFTETTKNMALSDHRLVTVFFMSLQGFYCKFMHIKQRVPPLVITHIASYLALLNTVFNLPSIGGWVSFHSLHLKPSCNYEDVLRLIWLNYVTNIEFLLPFFRKCTNVSGNWLCTFDSKTERRWRMMSFRSFKWAWHIVLSFLAPPAWSCDTSCMKAFFLPPGVLLCHCIQQTLW